jgi:hypothetical protein
MWTWPEHWPPEHWPAERKIKWWRRVDRVKSMKWYALLGLCAMVLAFEIHKYQPPHYLYRLFDAPNLPNIILMFVGIGGVWAALRTLRAIEKQVDAQVNAERAWMEVDMELDASLAITEVTEGQQPLFTVVSLEVKWVNIGRTPAWINATQISMMMLPDETHAPQSLPGPGFPSVIGPEMVGAGKDFAQTGTVAAEGKITRGQVGLIYGEVSYYDIFKQHHRTTFGFIVNHQRKVRRVNFMYPAYNEHT